ncbi:hypothetical protein DPMN_112835 [Dreissena polymorpha]|uniref:Uncharacterized protein n=1 Tax=Dreissena polymorpha TaxID=45954 RepID=A0A9D4KGD8_DREPO|nr:hypothetical protein DPMN_112835 [Dreissena polymorpha]
MISRNCPCEHLYYDVFLLFFLKDQHVENDFISLLKEIQSTRPLHVVFGKVWSPDRDPIGKQVPGTPAYVSLLCDTTRVCFIESIPLQSVFE